MFEINHLESFSIIDCVLFCFRFARVFNWKMSSSTVVQQFVSNQFSDGVGSTVHPHRYATSLVANNRIIEIHISDFPAIDHFPEDSLQEWNLHCALQPGKIPPSFCRLRQASAYVLVFDSSRPAPTFQYIRQIREQILSHGGKDVYKKPMVVAANKQDLVVRQSMTSSSTSSRTGYSTGHRRIIHQSHQNGTLSGGGGGGGGGINGAGKNGTSSSSEWSCTVRKQWRCLYVECSAKFNWQVSRFAASQFFFIYSLNANQIRYKCRWLANRKSLTRQTSRAY